MYTKYFRPLAACLLAIPLTLTACDRFEPSPVPQPQTTAVEAGSAAPPVVATLPVVRLADLQKIIAEAREKKQVLVIDFWATWCIPCVEMFPVLHEKLPAMGDNVRLVSVTLDAPGRLETAAIAFLHKHNALKDAYRIAEGEGDGPMIEVIEGLGKQWKDIVVPVILVYGTDGQLKEEFLEERAKLEVIIPRVQEIVAASQR